MGMRTRVTFHNLEARQGSGMHKMHPDRQICVLRLQISSSYLYGRPRGRRLGPWSSITSCRPPAQACAACWLHHEQILSVHRFELTVLEGIQSLTGQRLCTQMSEFHSASKLLQDIQIEYTRALDISILKPVQVHTPSRPLLITMHPQSWCQHSKSNSGLLTYAFPPPKQAVSACLGGHS